MKFDINSTVWRLIATERNVGITSLMKSYATFSNEITYNLHNAGFIDFIHEKPNDRWIL